VTGATGASGSNGVTGPTGAGLFTQNGNHAYYNDGWLGIGITGPTAPLHINSLTTDSAIRYETWIP
jgi:hypothetical protein